MNRKIYRFTVSTVLILFVLGTNGCGSKEPGRYYDKDFGFSIKFPEGWEVTVGDGRQEPLVMASGLWENDDDIVCEWMTVDVNRLDYDGMTLQEYYNVIEINSEKQYAHYQEIEKGDTVISGKQAIWSIATYTIIEGEMLNLTYFLVKGEYGYMISCNTEPDKLAMYKSRFVNSALSFRFE